MLFGRGGRYPLRPCETVLFRINRLFPTSKSIGNSFGIKHLFVGIVFALSFRSDRDVLNQRGFLEVPRTVGGGLLAKPCGCLEVGGKAGLV